MCQSCQAHQKAAQEEENVQYYCAQCNALKEAPKGAPKPECCGKKMQEVD